MPSFHQITFYHNCGHTEDVAYLRRGDKPIKFDINILPPEARIDAFRAVEVKDETLVDAEIDLHYDMNMCCYCDGSSDLAISQMPPLWRCWRRSNVYGLGPPHPQPPYLVAKTRRFAGAYLGQRRDDSR
ncbi:uncharacterized protein PAC_08721 [Phialocephala subalpina]|uniref:Uncharacterized protein n=1 Tax=Phialocephala subalpina TaxID=576137 RepID=A0A1L7X1H1_9HELO|nr:uncharacterized protein PAC_08721 [Phialocephala subalpina]